MSVSSITSSVKGSNRVQCINELSPSPKQSGSKVKKTFLIPSGSNGWVLRVHGLIALIKLLFMQDCIKQDTIKCLAL